MATQTQRPWPAPPLRTVTPCVGSSARFYLIGSTTLYQLVALLQWSHWQLATCVLRLRSRPLAFTLDRAGSPLACALCRSALFMRAAADGAVTALMLACDKGKAKVTAALLRHGADPFKPMQYTGNRPVSVDSSRRTRAVSARAR